MLRQSINRILLLVTSAAAVALALPSHAQNVAATYPARNVRIIVPFAAGGPPDVIARLLAQKLSERWGRQVYVEDLPGAGGNTGTANAARAEPDGYTLYMMSTGFIVNPLIYDKVPYDTKDFAAVTLAATSPNILFVNPSVPAKTVMELIDLIHHNPGKFSYAQPSTGSTPHLTGELLKLHYNLDLATVPYNAGPQAVTSTLAGHTPIGLTAISSVVPNIKEGNLRGLAVTAPARSALLPEVPTVTEAGVPDLESQTVNGLLVPARTPRDIVEKINRDAVAALSLPDVKEKLAAQGFDVVVSTPEGFAALLDSERSKWEKVVRDAKIKIGS
jgi:tripartite-type tricarboxylate transporter receptor subunit TctC